MKHTLEELSAACDGAGKAHDRPILQPSRGQAETTDSLFYQQTD